MAVAPTHRRAAGQPARAGTRPCTCRWPASRCLARCWSSGSAPCP